MKTIIAARGRRRARRRSVAGAAQAQRRSTPSRAKGFVQCGVNTGLAGFSPARQPGQLDAASTSISAAPSPRRCSATPTRSVHAAHRAAALHRAAVGRGRRAVAQHDLDAVARHRARPRLRRRQLLRRPGLHGAEEARTSTSAKELDGATVCVQPGTTTELNLADYFRANNMQLQAGGDRAARRGQRGLLRRPLRRLHHRRLGPRRDARHAGAEPGRPRHPARGDLQGAARPGRAPRRRRVGRHRALDALRHARGRGDRHHPAPMSTR